MEMYIHLMRTTIEFDPDTSAAIEELRRAEQIGVSDAVNTLIRRGMLTSTPTARFQQRTRSVGLRVDVSNIAEVLETLEGAESR
jgi:hypothetical protein